MGVHTHSDRNNLPSRVAAKPCRSDRWEPHVHFRVLAEIMSLLMQNKLPLNRTSALRRICKGLCPLHAMLSKTGLEACG